MANFEVSYDNMLSLEFNSPTNALHYNKGESGHTFMGIYEVAHPSWSGWDKVKAYLKQCNNNIKSASLKCYSDKELKEQVQKFYKKEFWNKMRLDEVIPYRTADLIFKFGVNVGIKRAVKYAQQVVKVADDGIVGINTLKALNIYSPLIFESEYKAKFVNYYTNLASSSRYSHFLDGWLNRVELS